MEKHWEYDTLMYLAFIYIEKAFARVSRKTMESNGWVQITIITEGSHYQYLLNVLE